LKRSNEDIEVVWARRQEGIRGILKLVRMMVVAVRTHAERIEREGGVTAPQLWLLRELDRAPGLRVVDLARIMAVHATTLRAMLAELDTQGLVREIASAGAPNTTRLALTEAGKRVLDAAPGPAQGVVFAALEKLDDRELETLAEALRPLLAAMQFTDGAAALKPLADLLHHPANRHHAYREVTP
jgi:DNA-binding MarR family transcriptional regulator